MKLGTVVRFYPAQADTECQETLKKTQREYLSAKVIEWSKGKAKLVVSRLEAANVVRENVTTDAKAESHFETVKV